MVTTEIRRRKATRGTGTQGLDWQAFTAHTRNRSAVVGVVGQGYVGFGLAQRSAEVGFRTYGIDISEAVVERCQRDNAFDRYEVTSDSAVLADCDVILIAVPTPTTIEGVRRAPDLSLVIAASETVAEHIARAPRPRLVVCESTYAPGTTRDVVMPILRRAAPRAPLALGYSPERIDPGNQRFELSAIPKVTSGYDHASAALTQAFYEELVENVVPASSMEAAEATKLLENTFRFVNIAFAHEFDEYCHATGLNSHEVTRLAATKPFGFMPFFAGAGMGGHCIAEDPYFFYESAVESGASTELLATSMRNHDARPDVIIERIVEQINRPLVEDTAVLVLGVTYKPNIRDTRRSPASPIMQRLESLGVRVDYHDPHVPAFEQRAAVDLGLVDPASYDLAVALVEHDAYDFDALRAQGWRVYRLSEGQRGHHAQRNER